MGFWTTAKNRPLTVFGSLGTIWAGFYAGIHYLASVNERRADDDKDAREKLSFTVNEKYLIIPNGFVTETGKTWDSSKNPQKDPGVINTVKKALTLKQALQDMRPEAYGEVITYLQSPDGIGPYNSEEEALIFEIDDLLKKPKLTKAEVARVGEINKSIAAKDPWTEMSQMPRGKGECIEFASAMCPVTYYAGIKAWRVSGCRVEKGDLMAQGHVYMAVEDTKTPHKLWILDTVEPDAGCLKEALNCTIEEFGRGKTAVVKFNDSYLAYSTGEKSDPDRARQNLVNVSRALFDNEYIPSAEIAVAANDEIDRVIARQERVADNTSQVPVTDGHLSKVTARRAEAGTGKSR